MTLLLRRGLAAAALAVFGALAGCGPGLGGTGTGDVPLPGAAAPVPALLCTTAIGAALGCSNASASAAAETRWVDSATGGQRQLVVLGNSAAWLDACAALRFDGDWAQGPQGQRFYGSTLAHGALVRLPASLQLEPAPGAALAARLYGPDAQPLGPVLLLQPLAAGAAAPTACPA